MAVDLAGNLYIIDSQNNRIRKVSNGVITTIAGTGKRGFSGDGGPATSALLSLGSAGLSQPSGVAVDSAGNIFIADTNNGRIREVTNGVISTRVGNGLSNYSGDGGPAISALLQRPAELAIDSAGNVFIADSYNSLVREVSNGVITTFAGCPPLYVRGPRTPGPPQQAPPWKRERGSHSTPPGTSSLQTIPPRSSKSRAES